MAQVLAASGLKVWMTSRHQDTLDRAKDAISIAVRGMLENNLADENYLSRVWDNLQLITNDHIPEIADKMDIVFETVVENKDAKREIYSLLDRYCRPDCIFASNTSGMDIFSVTAGIVHHPERQIIAHWFNPPHLMALVEVVCGEKTSAKTTSAVRSLLEYVGKKPAVWVPELAAE